MKKNEIRTYGMVCRAIEEIEYFNTARRIIGQPRNPGLSSYTTFLAYFFSILYLKKIRVVFPKISGGKGIILRQNCYTQKL